MIFVLDQYQCIIYSEFIVLNFMVGKMFVFVYGFNICFGYIDVFEGVDVILVVFKVFGYMVCCEFVVGCGILDIIVVECDVLGKVWDLVLFYVKVIGGIWVGVIKMIFIEEIEIDLFGEQVVFCGGVSYFVQVGFEMLIEVGYQLQIVYFEVLYEFKFIVDLMWEGGIVKQCWLIFDIVEFGDYVLGLCVIDECVKESMKGVFVDIQFGVFVKCFIDDQDNGVEEFFVLCVKEEQYLIEVIGKELCLFFVWKQQDEDYVDGSVVC